MATARRDTTTTMMTTYVDVDDDTSSTTSDEGDNRRGRHGRGKVARRSRRRRDNRGDATISWQTRGKREGRCTRGKREGRRQRTRGGGAPRGREAAAARREASRQPAGGASGASSSFSAYSPPRRDGGAPREIPSDDGGSDFSRVVREFGIGEIRASTVVVVDPLASPPSSPRRTRGAPFWRRRRPLRSSCGCSDSCGGWCDEKLTSVIRNYESPEVLEFGEEFLLAKGGRIFLIVIPQYVRTFLRRVIVITQNSKKYHIVHYDMMHGGTFLRQFLGSSDADTMAMAPL
jgi:hypothetical protein